MTVLQEAIGLGLVFGALYALISSGVSLQAGVMKIINIAHGHVMMVAMYMTLELHNQLSIDPYVGLLVTVPASFLLGCVIYIVLLHRSRREEALNLVIITLGLAAVLEAAALNQYSGDLKSLRVGYIGEPVEIGSVILSVGQLVALGVSLLSVAMMYLFLQFTYFGRAIRAAAEDEYAARLMGVNPTVVRTISFGIASAAAGVAGTVLMPIFLVTPSVGFDFLLFAFVAVVIGGLGSTLGAFIGGVLVGLVQSISNVYLAGSLSSVVLFGMMVIVLLWRPQGLLGDRGV